MPDLLDDDYQPVGCAPVSFDRTFHPSKRITTTAPYWVPPLPTVEEGWSTRTAITPMEGLQFFLDECKDGINGIPLQHILPEDLDFVIMNDTESEKSKNLRNFVEVVKKSISHEHRAVEAEVHSETKRALNAPFIVGLNHAISELPENTRVLIVGASVGNDLMRLRKAHRVGTTMIVDLLEPDEAKWPDLLDRKTLYRFKGEELHCRFEDYILRPNLPKYDLIIFHYSFQHVMRNTLNVSMAFEFFSRNLTPEGKVVACIMDPGGAMLLGEPDANSHSDTIRVLDRLCPTPDCEWGRTSVQVGSSVFIDPVVNLETLFKTAAVRKLGLNLMPGRETNCWPVTSNLKNAYRHPDMRAVIYIEIDRKGFKDIPASFAPSIRATHPGAVLRWQRTEPVRTHCAVENKGLPAGAEDLPFLRNCEYLISEKTDGVGGMLYLHRDDPTAYLVTGGKHWTATLPTPPKCALICQVEVMVPTESIVYDEFSAELVALDPVRTGLHPLESFYARLSQFVSAWDNCGLQWLGRKGWHPLNIGNFEALWASSHEGVVIQEQNAPPGVFRGVGSCRYVKKKTTFDCRIVSGSTLFKGKTYRYDKPDGIYEFLVVKGWMPGEFTLGPCLRRRYDKVDPNDAYYEHRLAMYLPVDLVRRAIEFNSKPVECVYFDEVCPETCRILREGICYERLIKSLEDEAPALGLTYRSELRFPVRWDLRSKQMVQVFSREVELQLLYIRYAAYVAHWTGRSNGDLASASSNSLASCV